MPAPLENHNRLTTGRRTQRHGLAIGLLGKKHIALYKAMIRQRRSLEACVKEPDGAIPIKAAYTIDAVILAQFVIRIAQRTIADEPDLPADRVADCLGKIVWGVQHRSAAIARLGIDGVPGGNGDDADPWGTLDRERATQAASGDQQPDHAALEPDAPAEPSEPEAADPEGGEQQ